MKNAKLFSCLLIIVSTALFAGCSREGVAYGDTAREAITREQWTVQYYFSGQDRTAEFSNYTFKFTRNGAVTVVDGTNSIHGSWNMVTGANRRDVLSIAISEAHLQGLNDQWTVHLISDGSLSMQGTSRDMRLRKL